MQHLRCSGMCELRWLRNTRGTDSCRGRGGGELRASGEHECTGCVMSHPSRGRSGPQAQGAAAAVTTSVQDNRMGEDDAMAAIAR